MFAYEREKAKRHNRIRRLEYAIGYERFIPLLGQVTQIIKAAEQACEATVDSGDNDYIDAVCAEEASNVEEAIGVTLLILQTRIRRVIEAAIDCFPEQQPKDLRCKLKDVLGKDNNNRYSRVKLIWELANYYKHRDEWNACVWNPQSKDSQSGVRTRKVVETVGIARASTGNLRTALDNLGIAPCSDCTQLANHVQHWAERILEMARNAA